MGTFEIRASLMGGLWMISGGVLAALFVGAGLQGELTAWHVIFAITVLVLAIVATTFLLQFKGEDSALAKAKRERIDNFLRDMSDEDLLELKQRLADGAMNEETILDYLTDDGELVIREK